MYKPAGATPLELVRALRSKYMIPDAIRIGYAGRLDPMADGVLLLLAGEENKRKHAYEQLSKTYAVRILFGFATDSFDPLGMITRRASAHEVSGHAVSTALRSLPASFVQEYPPYSSKTVGGVPLYRLSRNGALNGLRIPSKPVTILEKRLASFSLVPVRELQQSISARITRVHGDFRQRDILAQWETVFALAEHSAFPVADVEITATSGTYMRSLADRLGIMLGIPALAYAITRTRIGNFPIAETERLPL